MFFLSNFNINKVKYMSGKFFGCSSLSSLNLSDLNLNNVKDMSHIFSGCSSLTYLDYKGKKILKTCKK